METISTSDIEVRLNELLERTSRGESFQITREGRPVAKLVPPDAARNPDAIAEAVRRLQGFRGTFGGMTRKELRSLVHEGRDG